MNAQEMIDMLNQIPEQLRSMEIVMFDSGHTFHVRSDVTQLNLQHGKIQILVQEDE